MQARQSRTPNSGASHAKQKTRVTSESLNTEHHRTKRAMRNRTPIFLASHTLENTKSKSEVLF